MRALLICLAGVLIAGCASFETQVIEEPGPIDSIAVGRFITADPAEGELLGSYLRQDLSENGFNVIERSQNVLFGSVTYHYYYGNSSGIKEAVFVLGNGSKKIIWRYNSGEAFVKSNKEFSEYIVKQIKATLRE